jgi:hypothetical protein
LGVHAVRDIEIKMLAEFPGYIARYGMLGFFRGVNNQRGFLACGGAVRPTNPEAN